MNESSLPGYSPVFKKYSFGFLSCLVCVLWAFCFGPERWSWCFFIIRHWVDGYVGGGIHISARSFL